MNTIPPSILTDLLRRERETYARRRPRSQALAARAQRHFPGGVPMHWMADWPTPFPLFLAQAQGVEVTDVDGHRYADFCLGDTAAMFGHVPAPVARALAEQAARGLTTMLPGEDAVWVGEELARRFGLPYWQVTTTATDANRAALRWARAITGRKVIVVFNGCYHGTVDDAMVRRHDGRTVARPGLIGQVYDLAQYSRVVEFNDAPAMEAALRAGDVAAVLTEPALTNCGMVLPQPGFHETLRSLTRRYGALLIIDETHSLSTGPGGYTRAFGLDPDFLTLGKPIAGGVPAAVYGFTEEMAARMAEARAATGGGHSGIGTTLSANALAMHAMRVSLEEVMTGDAYGRMIPLAEQLSAGLAGVFAAFNLPWSVTQFGARCEFQFCPTPPRNGAEAEAAMDHELEGGIHLYLLNRGILITPFHNMMLVAPATGRSHIDMLVDTVAACCDELTAGGHAARVTGTAGA